MLQTGSTHVQTADFFNISQFVVSQLWARYQRHGSVADMQRSGRPRSTSRRDDRIVVNQALRNRSLTSTDLQKYLRRVRGVTVSRQTIRNRVHVGGLSARRPQVVLPLKGRHRTARLAWCTQRWRWNINQWSHVMFSGESRFTLDFLDRRRRVCRRAGKQYTDPARATHDRYGADNVYAPYVIPFARRHSRGFVF